MNALLLKDCLNNIYQTSENINYEIIVVSPFYVSGPRIKWVEDVLNIGSSHAVSLAYKHCCGDLIVLMVDDLVPNKGWLGDLWTYYWDRAADVFPLSVGIRRGLAGTVYGKYYPFFPVMSRASIDYCGGYFSSEFISCWGDPDLGLRVWNSGGLAEICPIENCTLFDIKDRMGYEPPRNLDKVKTTQIRDKAVFIDKWEGIYGKGWGRNLRDFNLDIPHEYLVNNTFNSNDPDYCRSIAHKNIESELGDFAHQDTRINIIFNGKCNTY